FLLTDYTAVMANWRALGDFSRTTGFLRGAFGRSRPNLASYILPILLGHWSGFAAVQALKQKHLQALFSLAILGFARQGSEILAGRVETSGLHFLFYKRLQAVRQRDVHCRHRFLFLL